MPINRIGCSSLHSHTITANIIYITAITTAETTTTIAATISTDTTARTTNTDATAAITKTDATATTTTTVIIITPSTIKPRDSGPWWDLVVHFMYTVHILKDRRVGNVSKTIVVLQKTGGPDVQETTQFHRHPRLFIINVTSSRLLCQL